MRETWFVAPPIRSLVDSCMLRYQRSTPETLAHQYKLQPTELPGQVNFYEFLVFLVFVFGNNKGEKRETHTQLL